MASSGRPPSPRRTAWLPLGLGEQPGRTLRQQLRQAVKEAIRTGALPAGTVLPASRALAADLGVSRGVVVEAYAQLLEEGFLNSRAGSGTVVAEGTRQELAPPTATAPGVVSGGEGPYEIDLRPGPPDLAIFPRAGWLAATREVVRTLPDAELGYVAPWGCRALRGELAAYLTRVRGAMVSPDGLVVVTGTTQGLTTLVRVLVELGHDTLAVESPSNAVQRRVLARYGLAIVDVPVDEDGLDVEELARTSCRAALVTPAHQYPCGVLLSPARRSALMRWAERVGGLVIEDDYDSEFRYDRKPAGSLQGLAPQHVALAGSVSKSLAPGLRLGWVVAPPALLGMVRAAKRDDDFGSAVLEQHVLAVMLANGSYDRHVRRSRRRYRERRDALVAALAHSLPDWRVSGVAGGLHLMVWMPPDVDEGQLLETAATAGLVLQGVRPMYGTMPPQDGLVIGYARAPAGLLREAVSRLAEAVVVTRQARPPAARGTAVARPVRPATAADYF